MNIAVYCGSSPAANPTHNEAARTLGTWIGRNGHTLVYGGCNAGLMGIVADAALAAGAPVIGVLPDIPTIQKKRHPGLTEYRYVESMGQRKDTMIELADAFVALPGGLGTIDEISDILALIRLNIITSGCVFVDTDGFYQPFAQLMGNMIQAGYMSDNDLEQILVSEDMEQIAAFLHRA